MTEQIIESMTPENARSIRIMVELCRLRDWLTDPEGEVGLSKDSCIVSVRMVQEVGRYFGLPAIRPVPVQAAVYNPLGFAQYRAWHQLPDEEKETTPFKMEGEAYAVGISGTDGDVMGGEVGGRWNGHLIAQIQEVFVDFSLDQFSRPAKGMEVKAGIFPVQDIWRRHGIAIYRRDDGVAITYKRMDDALGFRRAPDWQNFQARYRPIMGKLINKLKENLA